MGEEGLESFHGLLNERAVIHVSDEHFGLVGVAHFVGHLDFLDAHGEYQQTGYDEKKVSHFVNRIYNCLYG